MDKCDNCQKNEIYVYLTDLDNTKTRLCLDCYNEQLANIMGVELLPFKHGTYQYRDNKGKSYEFMVTKSLNPMGIDFRAEEVTIDGSHGYMVAVMGQVDCDQAELHRQLEIKIRETVSKKYLEENDYSWGPKYSIGKNHDAVGRIVYNDEDEEIPKLVIDGKEFSWEELGRMLMTYEGFQFKLELFDITEL